MKEAKKKYHNYRGARQAFLVSVLEGDGTEERPYEEVEYVLSTGRDGITRTLGRLQYIPSEDRWWGDSYQI